MEIRRIVSKLKTPFFITGGLLVIYVVVGRLYPATRIKVENT